MDGIPTPPGSGQVNCWRIGPGQRVKLIVLGKQLLLWPYHGSPRGALLCPRLFRRRCPRCEQDSPPRQERWAECRIADTCRRVVASFTEGAVKYCPALARQVDNARGLVVVLSRLAAPGSGVHAEVTARRYEHGQGVWAPICDLRQKLLALYQVDESNLVKTLPLLAEVEYESVPIPNVANANAEAAGPRVVLKLAGLFGREAIEANAAQERRRAVGDGYSAARSIGDTIDRVPPAPPPLRIAFGSGVPDDEDLAGAADDGQPPTLLFLPRPAPGDPPGRLHASAAAGGPSEAPEGPPCLRCEASANGQAGAEAPAAPLPGPDERLSPDEIRARIAEAMRRLKPPDDDAT